MMGYYVAIQCVICEEVLLMIDTAYDKNEKSRI